MKVRPTATVSGQEANARPSGTVTFLFTDIEGSTERWDRLPEPMQQALRQHDEILRAEIETCGGLVFKTIGDAFCAAFSSAADAVRAAVGAQRLVYGQDWSAVDGLRVRMALHTGVTDERDDDYFGPVVNRVARLLATAHGGQVILSAATAALATGHLPERSWVIDLGEHRLKNIELPERVYQLCAPGLEQSFPPLRSVGAAPNNLPRAMTTFVSGADDLAALAQLVAAHHLVTLTGPGGIGKSRNAVELGAQVLEGFPDGVWLIELAPVEEGHRVASVVGSVLGVREQLGTPMIDLLPSALATKNLLLIVDNCEHVLSAAADLVTRLQAAAPKLRMVVTSREPLRVAGEVIYQVRALRAPETGADGLPSIEQLRASPAVQLFIDRAKTVSRGFELRAPDAQSLDALCRRLDGIPLAIELAAARMNALSVAQIANRLDDRFRLLTKGMRTALPRQQTLRALVDWSFDLLDERERRFFAALSVFAGSFSLEAATAICASPDEDEWQALDLMTSLTDKSLLAHAPEDETFALLETTRFYAAERLRETGLTAEIAGRHLDYFVAFARLAAANVETTNGREWNDRMRAGLDNLRAALHWSIEQRNDPVKGIALSAALCDAWIALGLDREGQERIDAALACCTQSSPIDLRARLFLARAQIATRAQRAAIEPARTAVTLYRASQDERGLAAALNTLGYALSREDLLAEADRHYGESLAIATRIDNVRQRGLALLNLGVNRETENDFARARECYDAALKLAMERRDDYLIGAANLDLSVWCEAVDAAPEGFAFARRAYDAYERAGDGAGAALALGNMTTNLIGMNRLDEARKAAHDYVVHARAHRLDTTFVVALEKIAAIAQADGNPHAAAQLLGFTRARSAALGLKRDPGNLRFTATLLNAVETALGGAAAEPLAAGAALSEAAAAELALRVVSGAPPDLRPSR